MRKRVSSAWGIETGPFASHIPLLFCKRNNKNAFMAPRAPILLDSDEVMKDHRRIESTLPARPALPGDNPKKGSPLSPSTVTI